MRYRNGDEGPPSVWDQVAAVIGGIPALAALASLGVLLAFVLVLLFGRDGDALAPQPALTARSRIMD